jgi:CHAT domain-containing protein
MIPKMQSNSPNIVNQNLLRIFKFCFVAWLAILTTACSFSPWIGCRDSECIVNRFNEVGYVKADENGYFDAFYKINKVCDAFYEQQRYADLQECLGFYANRIKLIPYQSGISDREQASTWDVLEYVRQTSRSTNMEVNILLDFNRCDEAYSLSKQGIELIYKESSPFVFDAEFRELNRLAGIAAACLGNKSLAEKHINLIWNLTLGVFNRSERDVLKKHAVSDIFFAMGEYSKSERILKGSVAMDLWDMFELGVAVYSATNPGPTNIAAFDYMHVANTYNKSGEIPSDQVIPQLYRIARLYEALESYTLANQMYKALFSNKNVKEKFPNIYYPAIASYGFSLSTYGSHKQSISLFEEFIDKVESNRQTINASTSQIGYMHDKYKVYNELIRLLIKDGQIEKALEYAERSKSRTLVDTLETKMSFGSRRTQANDLLEKLDKLELNSSIRETESSRSETAILKTRLQDEYPELASLVSVPTVNLEDLSKHIPSGTSLVFYYGHADQLYGFVQDNNQVYVEKLDAIQVKEALIQLSVSLRTPDSKDYKETAIALNNLIFAPLEKYISNTNLVIVPHGELNYLPFSALHDGKRFLIEKYSYGLLPSLSIADQLKRRSDKVVTNTALVIGNPAVDSASQLKMSALESQAVSQMVISDTHLEGASASETAFKNLAKDFGLIHFAGHASFDAQYPLNSALLMSSDDANDGALTLSEIYDMDLNADLVTLSACETGLGKVLSGDEVVSLTQGLLYAGANSVVSSLWKVSDEETGYLMLNFYSGMQDLPKYKALQAAQKEILAHVNEHPYYWAAFQYTGGL